MDRDVRGRNAAGEPSSRWAKCARWACAGCWSLLRL